MCYLCNLQPDKLALLTYSNIQNHSGTILELSKKVQSWTKNQFFGSSPEQNRDRTESNRGNTITEVR